MLPYCGGNGGGYTGDKAEESSALLQYEVSCVYALASDVAGDRSGKIFILGGIESSIAIVDNGGLVSDATIFDGVVRTDAEHTRVYAVSNFELSINLVDENKTDLGGSFSALLKDDSTASSNDLSCKTN
jgi:hypothetical protein